MTCLLAYLAFILCVCVIVGTVIRTSVVKMLEMEKDYACTRCGQHFTMKADFEQFYSSTKPSR